MENRSREYREEQWKRSFQKHHLNAGWSFELANGKYIDNMTPIKMVCPKGHIVERSPKTHLKRGCPFCKVENQKSPVFGVGVNDLMCAENEKVYRHWHSVLRRCYSRYARIKFPSYIQSIVCPEWHYLSNFKTWFDENYVEGYQLDKDILVKGNKIYSPDTCCFVPQEINKLLTNRKSNRGQLPIGVCAYKNKYGASVHKYGKQIHIGYFDTPEEAFYAYKEAKEKYIKEVAQAYYDRGEITKRVYDALMRYEVEITD